MRTILALSLIAASFAFVPAADATTCTPVNSGTLCAGSYSYGTCENGGAGNQVYYYAFDGSGYTYIGASTYCGGYPGYYSYGGVGASATSCDAQWNCDSAGAYWDGANWFGSSYCSSGVFAYVDGQYQSQALPLCDVAGNPPAVGSLGLP